jgi:ubiquinone/menaquinone biosynthesis C-methylase UbiE
LSEQGNSLPTLYQLDRTNGWSSGMRAITHALLANQALPPGPLLELGCGSGIFNLQLSEAYPERAIIGVDLHPLALAYANTVVAPPPKLTRADLQCLPFPAGTFSAIIALDTFDQQGVNLLAALGESWRLLQARGMLILRVSAHAWLQGTHDIAFNTGRRFAKADLVTALQAQGFTAVRLTYANGLLAPPIIVMRLLQRWGWLPVGEVMYMDTFANRIFAQALRYEAEWLAQRALPFGISLYALAVKPA